MFLNTNFINFIKRKIAKPKHNFGYTKPLAVINTKTRTNIENMNKHYFSAILIIFLISFNTTFSQVIKLKTTTVNAQVLLENETWSEWTAPIEISELVVLDLTKKRISVFTKERQVYDIVEVLQNEKFENGNSIFAFRCIDQNGDYSDVSLLKEYENEILGKYLIVELKDKKLIYNLKDIE